MIGSINDGFLRRREAFPFVVFRLEQLGRGKLIHRQLGLGLRKGPRAVVESEGIAVGGKDEWDVESLGVSERLLHAACDLVFVVLRLDHGDWRFAAGVEQVIRFFPLASCDQFPPDDDTARSEEVFLPHLGHLIPPRRLDGRRDELGADVRLSEGFFVHGSSEPHSHTNPSLRACFQ